MRTFGIYTVTDGGPEVFITSVASAAAGKAEHARLKAEGTADYIRCRDCLGGLRFEYNLKTGRKTA